MQIFHTLQSDHAETALALGLFDGVHLAHAKVLRSAVEAADGGLVPAVLTFRLAGEGSGALLPNKPDMKLIFTEEQRLERMETQGIRRAYLPVFSDIMPLTAEDFLCSLRDKLHVRALACGEDYTFGSGAHGTVALLRSFCKDSGIALYVTPPVQLEGVAVSSTAIRESLALGDIPRANRFLGSEYDILGEVLPGRHLGNTLGFPTLNQRFLSNQAVPCFGVYASKTTIDDRVWDSITNIGTKPTIPGERAPLAETHLLGAEGDFYGKTARVRLLRMMRPEMKFNDIEELKRQVLEDIETRAKM